MVCAGSSYEYALCQSHDGHMTSTAGSPPSDWAFNEPRPFQLTCGQRQTIVRGEPLQQTNVSKPPQSSVCPFCSLSLTTPLLLYIRTPISAWFAEDDVDVGYANSTIPDTKMAPMAGKPNGRYFLSTPERSRHAKEAPTQPKVCTCVCPYVCVSVV